MKSVATAALDLMVAFMSWRGSSPKRVHRYYTTNNKAREMARRVRQDRRIFARRAVREAQRARWAAVAAEWESHNAARTGRHKVAAE